MARGRPRDPERDARAAAFADVLAEVLHNLSLTHAELARLTGVRTVSVDSWTRLSNPNLPGPENLSRLCAVLDVREPGTGERVRRAALGLRALDVRATTVTASRQTAQPSPVALAMPVVPPAAPSAAPPAPAPSVVTSATLPAPIDRFVGRDREIGDAVAFFSGHRGASSPRRLLTMIGVGGVGKSRLAIEAARAMQAHFTAGVFLIELAALFDAQLVTQSVAHAVGLRQVQGDWNSALAEYLQDRHVLLVIDNCEHMMDAVSELVTRLLRDCPKTCVLATSREPLRLAGEHLMRVPSLRMPAGADIADQHDERQPDTDAAAISPRELMRYDAIQLFVERARQTALEFELGSHNAAAVMQICRRLDAIPLAIELAAARLQTMSVDDILQGLDDRFALLTGGRRFALPRQQTLRATLMWSYQLLTPGAQQMLARMSVFSGGWSRDALKASAGASADALDELVEKSLVNVVSSGGASRYGMHETVREYGRQLLRDADGLVAAQHAHAAYMRDCAEAARRGFAGNRFLATARWLDQEIDNIRAALDWCRTAGAVGAQLGLEITGSLWMYWRLRGYLAEGRTWVATFMAGAADGSVARARAWMTDGVLAFYQSDYVASAASLERARNDFAQAGDVIGMALIDVRLARIDMYSDRAVRAITLIEHCLPVFQSGGDDWAKGYALVTLGEAHGRAGNVAAMSDAYESARAIFRAIGNTWGEAAALNGIAGVALNRERYADARRLYEQSLALNRELGDVGEISKVLTNIAECARGLSDWPSAIALCEEALTMRRRIGAMFGMAMLTHNLAHAYMGKGDLVRAITLFQDALRMGTGRGDVASLTSYIAGVASAMARRAQQPALAAVLCAVVTRERAAEVGPFDGADREVFAHTTTLLQQQLAPEDYAAAMTAGAALPADEAREQALAVPVQP